MSFGEYFNGFSQLGGNFLAQQQEAEQKAALAKLGDQVQSGNYSGAVGTAFGGLHDPQTGLGLLKLLDAQQQRKLTADADAGFLQGFGIGGPVGAPGGGPAPAGGVPSFLDSSGPSGSYIAGLVKRESNGDPNAQASTSSAKGLTQFIPSTWNATARQHPELGLTPVGNGQDGRTDPDQSIRAAKALTADNEAVLGRVGLPVSDASRYALHFLGASGGVRLVGGAMRNPDVPALNYADPKAVAANRSVFFDRNGAPKSAGTVMNDFARSFGGGGGQQAPAPRVASADPSFAPQMPVQGLNPGRPQQAVPAQRPVQYADDEAQTQALEQQMGMLPRQAAAPVPRAPQTLIPQSMAGSGIPGTIMDRGVPVAQVGSSDQANMPTQDAQPAQFRIPPGPQQVPGSVAALPQGFDGQGAPAPLPRAIPPSSAPTASNAPSPVPSLPLGGAPAGRVMAMPGDGPAPAAPATPTDRAFSAQASTMAQSPLGQRIPMLMRAVANPNLSEGPRQIAQTMLKAALDETAMPAAVKEWRYAQASGFTQARNPAEYAAEVAQQGKSAALDGETSARAAAAQRFGLQPGTPDFQNYVLSYKPEKDKGADLTAETNARQAAALRYGLEPGSPEFRSYVLTGKEPTDRDEGAKITAQIEARRKAAEGLGLEPNSPSYRSFVGTGKLGADRDMSAVDKKAIDAADNAVLSAQATIGLMQQAKALSGDAYSGPWAGKLSAVTGSFTDAGKATLELDNLVQSNALTNLKTTFGGNPTEGERKILLEVAGSSNLPHDLRVKIYQRAIDAATLRQQQNESRAAQIREGTYYRPGSGPAAAQGAPSGGQSGAPALPAPSPSNRPGAVSPSDRFGQLVGSGMSKADAYQQLHQEGY
ncbi:transglycosylase SLT domain-containing protein [Methylobacterium sp. J-088]|uniref:transglycosylase SLT domain-containing protein n=1 Tax=Methylobacterium sp. J-088 TaxID=2836664 RepID=UPI001FBBEEFD|nr:transglycosylase SLT domain-containing protein [Methylobacterium sp. J-088]MCJ2063239.1 transglycosylase SLT domain-containing protein [Methylobacterium sp. J-088]